ncbi:hypothetical protein RF11_14285 [Thelohanellus kitauei]|uniref:Uncharacterized protein n=1 Tax=Thelohanellus kitauei TaxID=669202 RepID=A0A0C2MC97_THEKT|nr:hypothetical protein RF11_14285 [Thelohanellus kitauei]
MVIRDVLDNIGIVVEALDSASWRELIFKGIRGSVYRIGMRPTLWIPKRLTISHLIYNGPLLRKIVVSQLFRRHKEPMTIHRISSMIFVLSQLSFINFQLYAFSPYLTI